MANNEDQSTQGAPAADIPDLKKKEKERKKAGAAWSGSKPGGGSFSGATGGTVARSAASAAGATSGAAAVQTAGAGWLSSMIAGLTATALGKAILAAGLATFLIGAGLFGYGMLKGGAAGTGGAGDLGAIASSMKIRANGGDRTGYVASKGEIRFDPIQAVKADKAEAEKAPEEAAPGEAAPPAPTADAANPEWSRPVLEHNMSGAKLSSNLGGGFGGKNIFAGSDSPKLNAGLSKMNMGGAKGRLSSARTVRTGRVSQSGRGRRVTANKALGQLKGIKGMSVSAASAPGAEATSSAARFEGPAAAGNVEGSPDAISGPADTPSTPGGAPDVTAPDVPDPDGTAVDFDNAAALAGIAALAKQAGEMKANAAKLMIAGIILIAAGIAAIATGFGALLGVILMAIGALLVGISMMLSEQAAKMKDMADQMSEQLAARTEDVKQDEINKYCIQQAYENGTDPKDCDPPESVTEGEAFEENESAAAKKHKNIVKENGQVEVSNGEPTAP